MQPPESPDSQVNQWKVTLKQRYPTMSEARVNELAVKIACMNRAERRKFFKVSSPKLPRKLDIPS
jgi:hypothetical protein